MNTHFNNIVELINLIGIDRVVTLGNDTLVLHAYDADKFNTLAFNLVAVYTENGKESILKVSSSRLHSSIALSMAKELLNIKV